MKLVGVTQEVLIIDDIAIECVMNEDPASDKIAEDNAARLAAYCLYINNLNITALRTHQYWINTNLGVKGSVDYMNTYRHPKAAKYCPYYILPHWATFKSKVKQYLDKLNKPTTIYRVRKTATDAKTQIGAYSNLNSAKELAEFNSPYKVFDTNGKLIYSPQQYYTKYQIAKTAPIKFEPKPSAKIQITLNNKTIKVYNGSETKAIDGLVWVKFTSPECNAFPDKYAWIPLKYLRKDV